MYRYVMQFERENKIVLNDSNILKKIKKIEHMHSAIYYLSYGTVLNITWYTT